MSSKTSSNGQPRKEPRRVRSIRNKTRNALQQLGVPIKGDPVQFALDCLYEAAGNVEYWRRRLSEQPDTTLVIDQYNEALDRKMRYSEILIRAGFAERLVRIKEQEGALLASAVLRAAQNPGLRLSVQRRALLLKLVADELEHLHQPALPPASG